MSPVVAIVGRPNVGKSTLLNRIIGRREAIVEERPGVTRDRKEVAAARQGRPFTLVDTGGWLVGGDSLDDKVSRQSEAAIAAADAVLFVVDATVGVTEDDARVAALLRGRSDTVIVVANKVDAKPLESLSEDHQQMLKDMCAAHDPDAVLVPMSNVTEAGVQAVKDAACDLPNRNNFLRPVDRVL